MNASGRRGIERKIFTSILWIGIVPVSIVLAAGYVAVRQWQGEAAEEALHTAARKTASGVRIASAVHLNVIGRLAADPDVIKLLALPHDVRLNLLESPQGEELLGLLRRVVVGKNGMGPSVIFLCDTEGNVVASTGKIPSSSPGPFVWAGSLDKPAFVEVDYSPETDEYLAVAAAPVVSPETQTRIGCLGEFFDIGYLVEFALGDEGRPAGGAVSQVAYRHQDTWNVAALVRDNEQTPKLVVEEADPSLAALLNQETVLDSGVARIHDYRWRGGVRDVFVAYGTPFSGVHIVAWRSAGEVFRNINLMALAALALCGALLVFLCLNAYRAVHNNIVRNVLLLNEGAQIIGQGDLELKLKIRTGDEIEELATSFNRMALALKRNIRQLAESEEKYRGLVTSMRDGVIQADSEGVIGFVNPVGLEILGFERLDRVCGRLVGELFPEAEELQSIIEELGRRGFVDRARAWVSAADGRRICLEVSGNLLRDNTGNATGMEWTFRDVTKAVQVEREAQERAARIAAINQIANVINSSLQAGRLYESLVVEVRKLVEFDFASISLLDEVGGAFEMRPLWPEQTTGVGLSCAVRDPQWCGPLVAETKESLMVEDFGEAGARRVKDFPAEIASCLCVPLHSSGRVIGTLNLGAKRPGAFSRHDRDVMEQMAPHVAVAIRNAELLENLQASLEEVTRAREKLYEVNEELKTLDEMKTNLLSNVSHELRTPLVAVLGYTDMIYNGKVGPINEIQREYLGITLRNIEKLVTLIENLLDFSKLHRGAETLVFDTFNLADCAKTSIEIIRPVAESREISIEVVAPEEPVLVDGDRGKLGQLFTNLLSNAVKFNHYGGAVRVEIQPVGDSVESIVTDTGVGIPPEAIDKIFTRFYQYDSSSTRKYGGAGIGLSIAQDIARLHGTRITVSSEVGKGSAFRFALPLKRPRKAREEGAPAAVPETHLLVELVTVDRVLCTQVRTLVEGEGVDVVVAGSSGGAVSLAHKHRPDCILVDMEEGQVSPTAVDDLLEDGSTKEAPIVVLTRDDELYGRYQPFVASQLKPGFRKSTLLSVLEYAVGYGTVSGEPLGPKILCVDDDPEARTFMTRCLEAEGYEVSACASGEQALMHLASREYGLVLLDVAMPGTDGWETCRRIKTDPRLAGIKVYLVTAKSIGPGRSQLQRVGSDGLLLKPFKSEDLVELVRGLETVRARKES